MSEKASSVDVEGDIVGIDTLDITSETIDFDEIEELLTTFHNDERVKEALEKGVDMREYSKQIETDLRVVEKSSIDDYVKESSNLAYLHSQIRSCDAILETMERLLSGFQADLGDISDEIKYLQDQSSTMSIKLKNRKAVGVQLSSFIDNIIIPPTLVKKLCEEEVKEAYIEYLLSLNKKIEFVNEQSAKKTAAVNDVAPDLDKLKTKAVGKIREFLLNQTELLQQPSCFEKRNDLLKYKYFISFLNQHAKEIGTEIRTYYQETMGKIVLARCKTYLTGSLKYNVDIGTKNDLLATPESALKGFFSDRFQKDKANVFSLGDRADILDDLTANYIPLDAFAANKDKYSKFTRFEVLFRSFLQYFTDTVTDEHRFQSEFFDSCSGIYEIILVKTVAFFLEKFQEFLVNSFDSVGILIMIKIALGYRQIMNSRGIAYLNSFFDHMLNLLWPRFAAIVALHIESVRNATAKSLGSIDIRAHYATRRYAEYLTSLLALNIEDARITTLVGQLRTQMDNLLQRLAAPLQDEKSKVIFLINNIDQVVSVLSEREINNDEVARVKQSLAESKRHFVQIELQKHFKPWILYTKEYASVISSPNPEAITVDRALTEQLAAEFAQNYKQMIEAINKEIITFFSNFKTGAVILQETLTELAVCYETFTEIVKKRFKAAPFLKDLIATNTLTWQIKKYQFEL